MRPYSEHVTDHITMGSCKDHIIKQISQNLSPVIPRGKKRLLNTRFKTVE